MDDTEPQSLGVPDLDAPADDAPRLQSDLARIKQVQCLHTSCALKICRGQQCAAPQNELSKVRSDGPANAQLMPVYRLHCSAEIFLRWALDFAHLLVNRYSQLVLQLMIVLLEQAYVNEKVAPDILEYDEELVDRLRQRLTAQVRNPS